MADQFLGEIRVFAFGATPTGWMSCDGQLLAVPAYLQLYSIIGNRFGGNGKVNFALPNLNGRAALGAGKGGGLSARELAATVGKETLDWMYLSFPKHDHMLLGNKFAATEVSGSKMLLARASVGSGSKPQKCDAYATDTGHIVKMGDKALSTSGPKSMERHYNMQPYLSLRFCIAYEGAYSSGPGE